ncbi:MAG: glycosyltransferase family 39 protein [Nitrospirae bacterium]|nr:glycosyltransferase family 39 protein [Nitrospirota bacterium]
MSKQILFIIILFIIATAYYLPIIKAPLSPYDEGVILVGSERVLKGQVPYKDFFTPYAPGQFYTLAAVFKVFGISVLVERIYDIVVKALISLFIFLIIRLLSSYKTAIVGWAMSLIWIEYSHFHGYPVYPDILLTYLSVYFLLLHMKKQKLYFVIFSSLSIVFAIIFRHDVGGLAAVVIAIVLMFRRIFGVQKSWTPLIAYIATGVIAMMPVIIYFLFHSDIEAMINDLFLIPLDMVANQQSLPYPVLSRYNLPFFVFPAVPLIGVITFFIIKNRDFDDSTSFGILLISLVGFVFFNQLWGRSDTIHLLGVALTGILLSPILLYTLSKIFPPNTQSYGLLLMLFIIVFSITLSRPITMKILNPGSYFITVLNPDIERAKYTLITPERKKTISYIKNNTAKDEYIYVGVKNHDQFVFNDAIIYFLAERNCATKYHELNPGINTTLAIQKEMVDELKDKSVRLIVLVPRSRHEPNQSGIDTGANLIDNYISMNYELIEKYGFDEIWMKKSLKKIS